MTNDKGFVEAGFPSEGVKDRLKYSYRLPETEPKSGKYESILVHEIEKDLLIIEVETSFLGGYYKYVPSRTVDLNPPPPFNLTIMFGIKNVVITRHFAEFVINSDVGKVITSSTNVNLDSINF